MKGNPLHSPALCWLRRFGVFLMMAFATTVHAQSTGTLVGVVTDTATGGYLVGAEVSVVGTPLRTATERDGSFHLAGVPAGAQTIEVSYVGRKNVLVPVTISAGGVVRTTAALGADDVIAMEAVSVESVREGQSRAINQQRTSNTVMNVISADTVGNLPDNTVGDALARLAGVSVVTEGRSAFASIRGAEAKLNSVTLDGAHISSPANDGIFTTGGQETRAVDLSSIPSDMVSSIEVIKAIPADRDADSFGGLINLVTRSAFDLPGRTINGKVEYRYNSLREDDGYGFSFNYSDVVNAARTLGITATLSNSKEKYGQNDYEIAYYDKSIPPVDTIPGITNAAISEYDQRTRIYAKDSLGANLNFDYRPGHTSQFYLKLFHNGSETDMTRWRLRQRGMVAIAATSTDALATGTEARITRRQDRIFTERTNERVALGGVTELPQGKLSYELNMGWAEMDANARRYQFETATSALRRNINWTVDRADPMYPKVTFTDRLTGENSLYRNQDLALNQLRYHNLNGTDEDLVGKLDYEIDSKIGNVPVQWKVGAKFRNKERKLDGSLDDYVAVGTAPRQSDFATKYEPRNVFEGKIPTLGFFPSIDDVFAPITANPGSYVLSPNDESTVVSISRYSATEDISALYGMGTAQFGKLQTVAGIRYEKTKVDYTYRPSGVSTANGGSSYDNLFPSVLLNYRFNKNLVLRAAFTNTLSRPDYGDMIPYESSLDPEAVTNLDSGALTRVFRGNPNLKAQKSANYDLSLEWYFQPTGMLSVAVFQKDIKDFIYKGVMTESRPPILVAVYQNLNGGQQDIKGTELTWMQSLSKLPAPFDGFGFSLNATFIEGESEFPTLNVTTGVRGTRTENFVPSQPKRVYNAQVYWEKYGFTARVAMNYIDEFVREVGGLAGQVTNNDATRWDAQLSYQINRNLTVFIEGKNLSEELKRWYNNTPNRPEELEYSGWNGAGGIRYRF
ncbi:MAG TPA: TonB-dependent receptor [Opitutaceae bacterium]|nr:TonB-dependent receptor [Opitutaceae bacterium]